MPKEDCWNRKREEEHLFTTWREAEETRVGRMAREMVDKRDALWNMVN